METLSDVGVFVRVVEEGNFTAAAVKLEISKAVVSKYITRIETRLGARLLNRTTRKLTLTEAGALLYEKSRRALEDLAEAEQEVLRLTGTPRGTLRVSAPVGFALMHVCPDLPAFLAQHPALQLDLQLDDHLVDLVRERVDVALRITQLTDSALVARRLAPCRVVLSAAPSYVERHGAPQSPADLVRHNCLTYPRFFVRELNIITINELP